MSWKKNSYFFDLQCRSFMTLNTFGTSTLTTSQKREIFFFKYVMNRTLYIYAKELLCILVHVLFHYYDLTATLLQSMQ